MPRCNALGTAQFAVIVLTMRPSLSQADVNRVMKVAAKHGMTVGVLPDGSIVIVPMPRAMRVPACSNDV